MNEAYGLMIGAGVWEVKLILLRNQDVSFAAVLISVDVFKISNTSSAPSSFVTSAQN